MSPQQQVGSLDLGPLAVKMQSQSPLDLHPVDGKAVRARAMLCTHVSRLSVLLSMPLQVYE